MDGRHQGALVKAKPNRHERKRRAIQRARSVNRVRANRERLARLYRRFDEAMRSAQEAWRKVWLLPHQAQKVIGSLRGSDFASYGDDP